MLSNKNSPNKQSVNSNVFSKKEREMSLDENRYDMRTQDGTSKQSLTVVSTASRLRRGGSRSRRMIFTKESHPENLIKADEDQTMLKSIMERKQAAKSSRNIIS